MDKLSKVVQDLLMSQGALVTGIATTETLKGGPPSVDLSYVLPEAKSAICFAVAVDQEPISDFLSKKDHNGLEQAIIAAETRAGGIALELSTYLTMKGLSSTPVPVNRYYRSDTPNGVNDLYPDISLRYLAVRSGVGSFGLSGNVIHAEAGSAMILGAVVTTAELTPTDPLPTEENYCDDCNLCLAGCVAGFMNPKEKTRVELGGFTFEYAKRQNYFRCGSVSAGFTGLHSSGKWSTWSPGRTPLPPTTKDNESEAACFKAMETYFQWPPQEGGYYHFIVDERIPFACANCQFICAPDKAERVRRFKLLATGGVVIQHPDGKLEAVTPEKAEAHLESLGKEGRALYEG
jgi:epoxyqueuosine reductase